jgi:DNA-nicking Smr family endonuclease
MYKPTHDTLDLHGTRHQEVFNKVDSFIGENLLKGTPSVFIITGHSKEMKKQVSKVLDDYEMYSQESIINPGRLTIDLT